jgi:hypothetical protein
VPRFVPKGASLDSNRFALAIAASPDRLKRAAEHWIDQLASSGIDVNSPDPGPLMNQLARVEHQELRTLVQGRSHLFDERNMDAPSMTTMSGCLLSLAETKPAAPRGSQEPNLKRVWESLRRLRVLADGSKPAPSRNEAAATLIAAREVADIARRIGVVEATRPKQLELSESLALFRKEGTLFVTPAASSYGHAPLVATTTGPSCRPEGVHIWDNGVPGAYCQRPGENLVYATRKTTDVNLRSEWSVSFDAMIRNLVIVAGGDSILLPRLDAKDELYGWFRAVAARQIPSVAWSQFDADVRSQLSNTAALPFSRHPLVGSQRTMATGLCVGIAMVECDLLPVLPEPEALIAGVVDRVQRLIRAHPTERHSSSGTTYAILLGGDDYASTRLPLELQQKWFGSRSNLVSLLGRSDRHTVSGADGRLSPFATYVRYNMGDAMFLGTILRVARSLQALVERWARQPTWGTALSSDVGVQNWLVKKETSDGISLQRKLDAAIGFWQRFVGNEFAWRHHGLVSSWARDAPGKAPSPSSTNPRIGAGAAHARTLVELLVQQDLVRGVCLALEFTPISALVDMHLIAIQDRDAARLPLARAHSFERLRLAYQGFGLDAAGGLARPIASPP